MHGRQRLVAVFLTDHLHTNLIGCLPFSFDVFLPRWLSFVICNWYFETLLLFISNWEVYLDCGN